MTLDSKNSIDFIISDINGKYSSLLKEDDYKALYQCKNIDEFIIKLNHYFHFINEDVDLYDLRSIFINNLLNEYNEYKNNVNVSHLLNYFTDFFKLNNFFNKLNKISNENLLGYFPELKVIEACKDFNQIKKICIENSFLNKYFENNYNENKEIMILKVFKSYLDFYYENSQGNFREIIKKEGDRQILEIINNGKLLNNKIDFFPKATTLTDKEIKNLLETENIGEIFKLKEENKVREMIKEINNIYSESFKEYNDSSCIYSYFKLKEQEYENILWIAECIKQNNLDMVKELIIFKE